MNKLAQFALGCMIGAVFAACAFIAVYLGPFWRSNWGIATFSLIFWVVMSLALGWGGKGKPYSLRFGVVASSAILLNLVMIFLITKHFGINMYVGVGLFFLLLYIAVKSKFLEKRRRELGYGPAEKKLQYTRFQLTNKVNPPSRNMLNHGLTSPWHSFSKSNSGWPALAASRGKCHEDPP